MGYGLSMSARQEITRKEAQAYAKATKKDKGIILDRLVAEVGWSRANARRRLSTALKAPKKTDPARLRKRRPATYGYDTTKVLIKVWATAGQPCGKYLAPVMDGTLSNMEQHKSFGVEARRYTPHVKAQLLKMSPATIDRLLAPTKKHMDPTALGATSSKKTALRELIPIMTHLDPLQHQPGIVSVDTVAHCGNTLKGEFAYTLTVTDIHTGWTINRAVKNKASKWIIQALDRVYDQFPFPLDHMHSDNGSEFLNYAVNQWATIHQISCSRSRPRRSNDNPWVEQKNGDIVRRSAFRYRYDTAEELRLLNDLWNLVNLRKNLFLPTKKATGYRRTRSGRHVRTYDAPRTPLQRVIDTGIMLPPERERMAELVNHTSLAALTKNITLIQNQLIACAAAKNRARAS